jgi:hypothetical protein
MNRTDRLRILRERQGVPIRDMAFYLGFRTPWAMQAWLERETGEIYCPKGRRYKWRG